MGMTTAGDSDSISNRRHVHRWRASRGVALLAVALASGCSFFRDVEPNAGSIEDMGRPDASAGAFGDGGTAVEVGLIDPSGSILKGEEEPGSTLEWTFELTKPQVVTISWETSFAGNAAKILGPVDALPQPEIRRFLANMAGSPTSLRRFLLLAPGEYTLRLTTETGEYDFTVGFDDFAPVASIDFDSPFKTFGSGTFGGLSEHDITIPAGSHLIARIEPAMPDEDKPIEPASVLAVEPATGSYWLSTAATDHALSANLVVPSHDASRYLWLAIRTNRQWSFRWE